MAGERERRKERFLYRRKENGLGQAVRTRIFRPGIRDADGAEGRSTICKDSDEVSRDEDGKKGKKGKERKRKKDGEGEELRRPKSADPSEGGEMWEEEVHLILLKEEKEKERKKKEKKRKRSGSWREGYKAGTGG